MVSSEAPGNILIGVPLNEDETRKLFSWAITILAHPNDTIVALHVIVGKEPIKFISKSREQKKLRRAKAFVLSTMAEFAMTCKSRQVHLEARVRYSSGIGEGVIQEAKRISAEFLLVGGSKKNFQSKGNVQDIATYCFKNSPKGCSVISIGGCTTSLSSQEETDPSDFSQSEEDSSVSKKTSSESSRGKDSPKSVLEEAELVERSSISKEEDKTSCFIDSSISASSPSIAVKHKQSPLKRISSWFRSSFDVRNKNIVTVIEEKQYQPSLTCFTYEEISQATNHFHQDNMVGQGGYSEVYRGDLLDGSTIAVKRLATETTTNSKKEKEFLMELGVIGHVSHPNTASLVGYCIENGLYLIFYFSPNGTLSTALHGSTSSKSLGWEVRYKIALGVARGLHYLHKGCKRRIIHRDIKASNVLLGPDYEPKITDFGLAKWLPNKWTHHAALPIEGTFGYLAPEYFMHGVVDEKTDVFALGILLLEIVTGRRPVDSSRQNLLLWATPFMESSKISKLVDPRLEGNYDADQLHKVVLTASYCVQQLAMLRPTMTEVLELLTHGNNSELTRSWRMPNMSPNGTVDDYSMVFGYNYPIDFDLDEDEDW